jgi:hypothetical protein
MAKRNIILFLFIILIGSLNANTVELEDTSDEDIITSPLLVLTAAIHGGSPGPDYNENYFLLTARQFNTYTNLPYLQVAFKYPLSARTRIAGFVGFNNISANDIVFDIDQDFSPVTTSELYNTEVNFDGIPIGAQYEFLPFGGQFRTFIAVGGGVELGEYTWNHNDLIEPEERNQNNGAINRSVVSPFIRLNAGTELGFDKKWKSGFFAGLSADISVSRYFRSIEAFRDIDPFFVRGYAQDGIGFFPWQVNFGLSLMLNITN